MIPSKDQNILIIDSACDQSIINSQAFVVLSQSGTYFYVNGAMQGMQSENAYEVVNGATLATFKDGSKRILIINQALYDPHPRQIEALLQPHQSRAHGCIVDDCSKHHLKANNKRGTQSINTPDDKLDLHFDGLKTYFAISKPSKEDLVKYPHVELTSPKPYEPTKRVYTRRRHQKGLDDKQLEEWRARLGYAPLEVVKKTLEATTQMVPTVEAESRSYMRDHFKTRLPMLRPHRVNDTLYTDTFFSSTPSIRGYRMWQLFSFDRTKLDVIKLMKKKSQAIGAYEDIIREIGAPNYTVTDDASELTGRQWRNINRKYCIEGRVCEPYHQNQNLAERRGGGTKTFLLRLYLHTPWAPMAYWCYALEYIQLLRGYLAQRSLGWRPANEIMTGETLDISAFRFAWFEPIWYYDPKPNFPEAKMKPGFVLGIDPHVGDGFSYIILPVKDAKDIPRHRPRTLVRSVVRKRDISLDMKDAPTARTTAKGFIKFYDSKDQVLCGTEELEPEWDAMLEELDNSEVDSYYLQRAQQAEKLPGKKQLTSTTLGEIDGPMTHYPVPNIIEDDSDYGSDSEDDYHPHRKQSGDRRGKKIRFSQDPDELLGSPSSQNKHTNDNSKSTNVPLVENLSDSDSDSDDDSCLDHPANVFQYLSDDDEYDSDEDSVSSTSSEISSPEDTDIADDINSQFNREECDDYGEIVAIKQHRDSEGMLEMQVLYSTGELEWHPMSLIKEEDPHAVAHYLLDADLGDKAMNSRHKRWARKFLRDLKKTMRRMFRVDYDGYQITVHDSPEQTLQSRRSTMNANSSRAAASQKKRRQQSGKRKKPGKNNRSMGNYKYGVRVPKNWKEARALDKANGDNKWKEAVEKEIAALIHHNCFKFVSSNYKLSSDYQYAPMKMCYEVKNDLKRKARFVIQGCKVDPRGLST